MGDLSTRFYQFSGSAADYVQLDNIASVRIIRRDDGCRIQIIGPGYDESFPSYGFHSNTYTPEDAQIHFNAIVERLQSAGLPVIRVPYQEDNVALNVAHVDGIFLRNEPCQGPGVPSRFDMVGVQVYLDGCDDPFELNYAFVAHQDEFVQAVLEKMQDRNFVDLYQKLHMSMPNVYLKEPEPGFEDETAYKQYPRAVFLDPKDVMAVMAMGRFRYDPRELLADYEPGSVEFTIKFARDCTENRSIMRSFSYNFGDDQEAAQQVLLRALALCRQLNVCDSKRQMAIDKHQIGHITVSESRPIQVLVRRANLSARSDILVDATFAAPLQAKSICAELQGSLRRSSTRQLEPHNNDDGNGVVVSLDSFR